MLASAIFDNAAGDMNDVDDIDFRGRCCSYLISLSWFRCYITEYQGARRTSFVFFNASFRMEYALVFAICDYA